MIWLRLRLNAQDFSLPAHNAIVMQEEVRKLQNARICVMKLLKDVYAD